MKKIGLCLAFKGTNYGALLQAFATQYLVNSLGYRTEILDYTPERGKDIIHSPESYLSRVIEKSKKALNKQKVIPLDEIHKQNKTKRIEAADLFRQNRLHNIVNIKTYDDLVEHSRQYNAVIVGSDQLWPPTVSFTKYRSLRFVPKDVRRISFATSMGVSSYPWYVKRNAADFLRKIDFLSVREETAKSIIKNICGRDAKVVLDPTYLISKSEWEDLIHPETIVKSGYVFSFFLGDNPEMKKLVRKYADNHGLRVVAIISNEANSNDQYADEVLIGQSPEQFVNLIRNADCVFTDSFHGLAFSIINCKQVYITYRIRYGTSSRNSRIDNIVKKLGIENRLIINPNDLSNDFDNEISYDLVNDKLRIMREDSLQFLKEALSFDDNLSDNSNLLYDEKRDCCGCEACANICPLDIIQMVTDDEGFRYPHLLEPSKCINCGACKNVCPVRNSELISSSFTKAYAGWSENVSTVCSSSSGGFASTLTESFIWDGGIVYGVSYSQDYSSAIYERISKVEQIDRTKTSKYIQAQKNNVYLSVKNDLKNSKVLFIGLPCDVYAMKRFVKNDPNLYTLSLICHGPTSEKIQKLFCKDIENEIGDSINSFSVRYKNNGQWKPYYIRATGINGKEYLKQFNKTDYNIAFLYFKRPSCMCCNFKNNHFAADILIGDYHAVSSGSEYWNEHGVSSILPLTNRGVELLNSIKDSFHYSEIPLRTAISQKAIHSSVNKGINRVEFLNTLNERGLHEACCISSIKNDMAKSRRLKRNKDFKRTIRKMIKKVIKR